MFFTRTLTRKLVAQLCLVVFLVVVLSVTGIYGLTSYRETVRRMHDAFNEAPQKTRLAASMTAMLAPLRMPLSSVNQPARRKKQIEFQQQEFWKLHSATRDRVITFHKGLEDLSEVDFPPQKRQVVVGLLSGIHGNLARMRALSLDLADSDQHDQILIQMLELGVDTELTIQQIPDPVELVGNTLEHARREARTLFWVATLSAVFSVAVFAVLMRFGWSVLIKPLRNLHEGFRRVANGEYDYAVQVSSRDEMAELAEDFNAMTRRFRETKDDLDRQVDCRSQQLVRSERLAGVGFLAAGVAHEINNPLAAVTLAGDAISDRITPLLERLDPDEAAPIQMYLQMIQNESARCKQITERLLDFARGRDGTRERTDIVQIVNDVVLMVQHLSKYREKNIDFTPTKPCYAEINGAEVKQVVLNLVANGLEAMERGGTLHIQVIERLDLVELRFRDEGCGMTAEVKDQIFEPFFTQKETGQGTGLGLSISHRIIQEHNGSLTPSSDGPGLGSTFTVRLPRKAALNAA